MCWAMTKPLLWIKLILSHSKGWVGLNTYRLWGIIGIVLMSTFLIHGYFLRSRHFAKPRLFSREISTVSRQINDFLPISGPLIFDCLRPSWLKGNSFISFMKKLAKNWQKCKTMIVITYLFGYSLLVGAIACYYHKQEDVLDFIQKLELRYNFGNKNSWRVSQKNRPPIQRAVRNCVKDLSQIELEETVLHDLIILHAMIAVTTVQTKTV